jgi:dTDP-4-amino-4,6-dideoxygalactose transaminase
MTHRDAFRRTIGDVVGVPPDNVTLFWKGRVALYATLRALGIGAGDEVIVPAFTCVAVPNAILYTGAVPVYVDIDETTYTVDVEAVAGAAGPNTRAILAQNTFGLSADLDALSAVAARHGAALIDDCTHGLGGTYRGRPNGTAAQAAFYSTQWSKPISTGLGGIAVTRDTALARELRTLEEASREPTAAEQALLCLMVSARSRITSPSLTRVGRGVYRAVSRAGVVPGSSTREELEGPHMPAGFVTRMSAVQARLGRRRLPSLAQTVVARRTIAERYSEWLVGHGCTEACEPPSSTHAFLRYPIRVRERDAFLEAARRRGLDLGDWFHSPLYPLKGDLSRWLYRPGMAPVAERVTSEIVNLPTDVAPDGKAVRAIEALLEASVDRVR